MSNTVKVLLVIGLIAFIYFAAFNEKDYAIVVGGPVKVVQTGNNDADDREITDLSVIRQFDGAVYREKNAEGKLVPAQLSTFVGLEQTSIRGGVLRFKYLEDRKQLWVMLEFRSPAKLDNKGLSNIVVISKGVFLSGAGPVFSRQLAAKHKGVRPMSVPTKVFVRQYRD